MSFEYDPVGNRKKRTDYMGRVTNYTFDNLNRLTKIEYDHANQTPKAQSTYGYADISRLTSAVNEAGTVTFGYDNRNRMTSTTDVFNQALVYEYERTPTVNQKRLTLNGALYATYNFDNDERLSNIVNASDSATISFGYDNEDKITSRNYPNGVVTTYEYDNMDRLRLLRDVGPSGTLFDRQYGYNTANQISQITELTGTRMFGYDNVNRLTGVTGSVTESYLFDDVGNRTSSHRSSSYGYQPFNKIATTQTATYGSDANGNMTTKSEGSNFWRYTWDFENRMAEAATRKQKVRYKFDALGRRVSRSLGYGKESTKFTYDGLDVLQDDNAGTLTKYLNGGGIDNKLRQTTGSTTSYFLADHLGSTNGLTNSSGALSSSNGYDSFGNPTNTGFSSRYQFTGREFDNLTGLQYSRARFYDPNLGRFISEDPIGLDGGINQYGYVSNNPLNANDPFGLYEKDVHYYLTYYLAMKTKCFSQGEATAIANGNQMADDDDATAPGYGRTFRNSEYHALPSDVAPGTYPPHLPHGGNYMKFGRGLHYLQDRYSHAGYKSSYFGHFRTLHYFDKTNSDPETAMAMAEATYSALASFAGAKGCKCSGTLDPNTRSQIDGFNRSPGSHFGALNSIDSTGGLLDFGITNPRGYLDNKRRYLDF